MTAPATTVQVPKGMVCITTHGMLTYETSMCLMEMRSFTEKQGITPVWHPICNSLVESARNAAVMAFLNHPEKLGWLLFVDGDMVFKPDALCQLLSLAYGGFSVADALGAHCTLRGEPYLPTIDTGTGTWESVLPGGGPIEVMRTGSAFILMKRHCYEQVPAPWYRTKQPGRPIDALADLDNYAIIKFDGKNPFADTPEWKSLMKCARDDDSTYRPIDPLAMLGEDSNWCDRMRFAGLRIFVSTDTEIQHVDRAIRGAADHREQVKKGEAMGRTLVGLTR